MKYCLANTLSEPIKSYQWDLVCAINKNFPAITRTREQSLPAHFTLKYEFETDDISGVEQVLEKFSQNNTAQPVNIGGFDSFTDKVVFIKVQLSQKAQEVFGKLIDTLQEIHWMQWKEHDGKTMHFHSTVAEECGAKKEAILNFLQDKKQDFETKFDNITIFQKIGESDKGISLWQPIRTFQFLS